MELSLTIIGLIIAVLGLLYAIIAHPQMVDKVQNDPRSLIALLSRAALFNRMRTRTAPDRISFYELYYNPSNKTKIDTHFASSGRTSAASFLHRSKNWIFVLDSEFKNDLFRLGLDYNNVLVWLIEEFSSHSLLLKYRGPIATKEMAIRSGFFVTAVMGLGTPDIPEILLKRICPIDNEISSGVHWSECRDSYFVCRMLPHRWAFVSDVGNYLSVGDVRRILNSCRYLENALAKYLATATELSSSARERYAALFERIAATTEKLNSDDQLTNGEICVSAEVVISYAHKIIFGASGMSDDAIADISAYTIVEGHWYLASARLRSVAQRPKSSIFEVEGQYQYVTAARSKNG